MSGVVLRCPNCGTIQGSEGQCDACHEASVRYFCTNHTPGQWVEGSACPQCGARFGDPEPSPEVLRPVERPIAPPRPTRTPRYRPAEPDPRLGPWDTEASAAPGTEPSGPPAPDPFRILLGAVAAAARARSMRAERRDYDDLEPTRRRGGGCFGRVVMLLLFLIALFLLVPVFLGALLGFG